jgi:hypothetical protein
MSQRTNNSFKTSNTNKKSSIKTNTVGIVVDVILNEDAKNLVDSNQSIYSTGKNTSVIGSCVIRDASNQVSNESDLPIYPPLDPLNLDIPLVGETVELIKVGNVNYYRRLNVGGLNRGNAKENFNKNAYPIVDKPTNNANSYSKTSQTGIVNSSNSTDRDTKIGTYFEDNQVNRLRLYEGDKLIQSRFGQSIRFSGYNNPDNEYAPTIMIRNRQNAVSINDLEVGDITEEDINRDGSSIIMTSGQYKIPFQPGTVDEGGSSNFETKPDNFEEYPSELVGNDQILINSDRIILSAKSQEMIFYSKGNWGFISDGKMSIDNGNEGANLNFNGDVRITTNDNSTYILGGKGNIFLNTEESTEPLVRGETLKKLLERMIDLIVKQVYQTPSGPTAVGPTNQGEFNKLKAELDTMLSELNFTDPQ